MWVKTMYSYMHFLACYFQRQQSIVNPQVMQKPDEILTIQYAYCGVKLPMEGCKVHAGIISQRV